MKAALIQWGNTNKVTSPLYILISEQCEVVTFKQQATLLLRHHQFLLFASY